MSEYDITSKLAQSDLIVYPYQKSNESSSAAVRNGLKSGSSIAVTPLGVFQDVESIAYKVSGFTAYDLFTDIREWHQIEISKSKQQIEIDNTKVINWLDQFDFQKISLRLENLIESLEYNRKSI